MEVMKSKKAKLPFLLISSVITSLVCNESFSSLTCITITLGCIVGSQKRIWNFVRSSSDGASLPRKHHLSQQARTGQLCLLSNILINLRLFINCEKRTTLNLKLCKWAPTIDKQLSWTDISYSWTLSHGPSYTKPQ